MKNLCDINRAISTLMNKYKKKNLTADDIDVMEHNKQVLLEFCYEVESDVLARWHISIDKQENL